MQVAPTVQVNTVDSEDSEVQHLTTAYYETKDDIINDEDSYNEDMTDVQSSDEDNLTKERNLGEEIDDQDINVWTLCMPDPVKPIGKEYTKQIIFPNHLFNHHQNGTDWRCKFYNKF